MTRMTRKAEISDSAKHKGTTRAHPDNWKIKVKKKNFLRFARRDRRCTPQCIAFGSGHTTPKYLAPALKTRIDYPWHSNVFHTLKDNLPHANPGMLPLPPPGFVTNLLPLTTPDWSLLTQIPPSMKMVGPTTVGCHLSSRLGFSYFSNLSSSGKVSIPSYQDTHSIRCSVSVTEADG